jgi:ubiquitin-protein ligase E3 D
MIHLYSEHLLNIRTLSIQASLSTVSNKETKATLSADGSILTLSHEGEQASINLPINLSPNKQSNVTLTIPAVPSKELSFRVNLEQKEDQPDGPLSNGQHEGGNIIPWTAEQLTSSAKVLCRYCDVSIIEPERIYAWKDLPSEGWAEMMDFWHCHKPHDPHEHADVNRGYTSGSKLALEAGVGMVDPLNFLFLPDECEHIQVSLNPLFPRSFHPFP